VVELNGSDRISFDAHGHSPVTGSIVLSYQGDESALELRSDRGLTHLPDLSRPRSWLDHLR